MSLPGLTQASSAYPTHPAVKTNPTLFVIVGIGGHLETAAFLGGTLYCDTRLCKDTLNTLDIDSVLFSHFPSQDVPKQGKSRRVKALPAKSLQDADKMVKIRMPDVNKNAGPNRGVSTKGMQFLGIPDRRERPPKGMNPDGQPRSQNATNP